MTLFNDDFAALAPRDDDEGLFSRDFNGQLVRLDAPTESDYDKTATLQIDGKSVTVPLAEPLKDAQGNVVLDLDSRTTPRYTTIYDAATKLKEEAGEAIAIPVLCHQPHMTPVAVCRLCVVQIYGTKRGKRAAERKLLPACQHQVKDGMEVFTMNAPGPDGERVRRAVSCMTELLAADHLKMAPEPAPAKELAPFNELQRMMDRVEVKESRFKLTVLSNPPLPKTDGITKEPNKSTHETDLIQRGRRTEVDTSSPVFIVDHSACILCDRCQRACDEVKNNNVITRTGKGATAGIAFDLNDPMGESSCVQCGECMVSCPTSAITFRPVKKVEIAAKDSDAVRLSATELIADPLFAHVPPKFLLWQSGLAVRRSLKKDEFLCKQGEAGNTAFIIKSGLLAVNIWAAGAKTVSRGFFGLGKGGQGDAKPAMSFKLSPQDLIAGEMSCLSGTPRTADLVALEASEVWEIRRNVLDRLMRTPEQRARIEEKARKRALDMVLQNSDLIHGMSEEEKKSCNEFLRPRLRFVRVNPGQVLFRQGDWADFAYIVRLGHVRVGVGRAGKETNVVFLGPGAVAGEIGLLGIGGSDIGKPWEKFDEALISTLKEAEPKKLGASWPSSQRTATCMALDHVELAQLAREDFLEMLVRFPQIRRSLVETAFKRIGDPGSPVMRDYVKQGLYQGQSLLVLDLNSCTRCDECTKACVDQHGSDSHGAPITRLLREGLRFGDSLVATSCRSCKDAYCMIGCPVDAIHRGKHQQIVIEDHCIGCGLCEQNCPYGNIWTLIDEKNSVEMADRSRPGETIKVAKLKAATCDLCDSEGEHEVPKPRCVNACPHDAAHRMTGPELLSQVLAAEAKDL